MSTAQHLARHAELVRELQGRRGLDERFVATIIARTPGGFEHHGEANHHALGFHPICEAFAELSDYCDLMFIHGVERVQDGIAEEFASATARKLYAECEWLAAQLANAHTALMAALGAFDDDE
jgi:hypothetical protein